MLETIHIIPTILAQLLISSALPKMVTHGKATSHVYLLFQKINEKKKQAKRWENMSAVIYATEHYREIDTLLVKKKNVSVIYTHTHPSAVAN